MGHSPWISALVAAGLSGATLALLELGRARLPHAHPTDRSLHSRPVSRVGGIAVWVGFLPVALMAPVAGAGGNAWLIPWGMVTAVSLADDWHGVSPRIRLSVQTLAALIIVLVIVPAGSIGWPSPVSIGIIAGTTLAVVWSANLFNFMDGSDGLAAIMAILGFAAYGVAAAWTGMPAEAFFALAAATLAFLAVNKPPARTFMGDVGSVPLGFLAAVFGLAGIQAGIWPPWFPPLVFLPFVADSTATMIRRIVRREDLFVAHKSHYYQRLHQLGAGHGGTLLFFFILITGTAASALFTLATGSSGGWRVLTIWTAAIGVLFAGIDYHWRHRAHRSQ